jgi:hypothetical protein
VEIMARIWMGIALAAALAVGCSQESSPGSADAEGVRGGGEPFEAADQEGVAPGGEAAPLAVPAVGPTVIKTADLEVEVGRDGFADAMAGATSVAARHQGFVVSTSTGGAEARRGTIVLRVPAEGFEDALNELRGLGEVQRQRVSGEDVGQEFVDLEARLRHLHAQEQVMLALFDDATTVADTIRIQNELSRIQLQIEEIEGRLRYLRDQTSLSTISLTLAEEGVAAPGAFDRAWERAVDGFVSVFAALVVGLGYVLPFAAIGLAGLLVYRRVRPSGSPG